VVKKVEVGLKFHDLRRTAVKSFNDALVPQSTAMDLVGHKTASVYRRYSITNEQALREAVARRDAARNAG
jgi:hypothetical protein